MSEEDSEGLKITPADIRFTTKGSDIYAIFLAWPDKNATIKSLGLSSPHAPGRISNVRLLGTDAVLNWKQDSDALAIRIPREKPCDYAYCFKIVV
jgi:alpha-L-fucosidase